MNSKLSTRLQRLLSADQQNLLAEGMKGLEKESLRLDREGAIAQTPHPPALGSALTHPWITTDYSEALIELITPPFVNSLEALEFLGEIHQFVYSHLKDEILLATSMPIGLAGEESIPIACYGSSNIGHMKHVYRRGLDCRYGRIMQSIAGVHFNYSVNEALWPVLHVLERPDQPLSDYIADGYFGIIRNIHRHGWLLIYLFGNSPAISKSFFAGREELASQFQTFDRETLYKPYATSLRMSDIGYRNDNQTCLDISFNNLDDYVASLQAAISQPHPAYEKIGVKVDGVYRQLNANILQIENEYYSAVRPKQIAKSGEKPTLALKKRGVRYLEIRALDLGAHQPAGISLEQMQFLEVFILHCLMLESPALSETEKAESSHNSLGTACCGRTPGQVLFRNGTSVSLRDWGHELLDGMLPIADIMDRHYPGHDYTGSVQQFRAALEHPDFTLASQVLDDMKDQGESFTEYALRLSRLHRSHWCDPGLSGQRLDELNRQAACSRQEQERIERSDTLSFDEFLAVYQRQT